MQSYTHVQLIKARGLEPRGFIRFDPLSQPVAERDGASGRGVAAEFGNDFGQRGNNGFNDEEHERRGEYDAEDDQENLEEMQPGQKNFHRSPTCDDAA